MKLTKLSKLIQEFGVIEIYDEGQVFHAQDFPEKLFVVEKGYVKRYQATNPEKKVLELIYGPGHMVSLSQLYKKIFNIDQNQDSYIYLYQAMTDVEMSSIDIQVIASRLDEEPELYKDLFYESGLKLRSNIFHLASNALTDDYQKVAHLLVNLAYEFGGMSRGEIKKTFKLPIPQRPIDIAEQLNISKEVVEAVLNSLRKNEIISIKGPTITILNIDALKDKYLD